MDNSESINNELPQRPKFLTRLCILSFIGNISYFLWTIWGYYSITKSEDFIKNITTSKKETHGIVSEMELSLLNAYEHAVPNLIIGLFCACICFYGVLLIWKLKRKGFYIYAIGELIPPIAAFFIGGDSLIGKTGSALLLLLAVIWIVMYAINFKHLNK
jgi:hypothetical protein